MIGDTPAPERFHRQPAVRVDYAPYSGETLISSRADADLVLLRRWGEEGLPLALDPHLQDAMWNFFDDVVHSCLQHSPVDVDDLVF